MPITHHAGADVHWFTAGDRPGLLFIHGAGGNAAIWWQQVEVFAKTHKVVVYDHRAFGRSTAPDRAIESSALSGDAQAVMDAAGLSTATVVCQSLGGWTGIRLALDAPERVNGLVFSCTMGGIAHQPAIDSALASFAKMDERGPASIALGAELERTNPAKAYLYEQVNAFNTGFDPSAAQSLFDPETMVPMERLSEVACPFLLIAGAHDAIWPPASLEGLVPAFANGRMEIVPNSGHSPYFEQPETFNEILSGYLKTIS